MTLEEKLERSKNLGKIIEQGVQQNTAHPRQTASSMTGSVEYLDSMVFGQADRSSDGYDAKEEMKRIQERAANGNVAAGNSRIPKSILESIKENPLNMQSADPQMDAFTEKLATVMPGIRRSAEVMSKLNETKPLRNEQPKNEAAKPAAAGIDYEILKLIVENAVKKEMNTLKASMLNESSAHMNGSSPIRMMKLTETGKFLFLDNDDNIFECSMRYVGKNKKKK